MAGSTTVVDLLVKAKDLASAPIRGIVASIKFLDSEISVVAGKIRGAFSGLFGGGLDGAIEFEAQLSKVAAKGGFTAAEMAKLKQAAIEIGPEFDASGTEAAQGMEALAAAGLDTTKVIQALPYVLAVAKTESVSMDVAAEKLSDSLSSVGLGFDQSGRMANVLAKGANISTTSVVALAGALSTAGGIAKTANLDLEQTVGDLAALANAGIKGEKAGTALAAILTQLINPASNASKELSALGIHSRDLGEVLAQLKAKGAAGNAAILAFGETAGPGLRALLETGADGVAALENQLRNADGAAKEAALGINSNLKGALSALTAAWDNVKTALFDPVLEPLAKQARDAAKALNDNLASGALKPVQEAIRSFADNGAQAARDFIAGFDFKAALQSVQSLASGAKESFDGIKNAGVTAASVVQIAWNGLTAGFKTIGASLLAVAASAVSNIAAIEEAASKVGLGSLARANELRATATDLAAKAGELTQSIAQDGEDIKSAFDRLTSSASGAKDGIDGVAEANQKLKDSAPAQEITEITKSLDDYRRIAALAATKAQETEQAFWDGKASLEDFATAADEAKRANDDLAAATERQTAAEKQAAPQRKQSAVELQAAATAAEDAAKRQGDYASALAKAGGAQTDAIRSEIDLARAKGDTATVADKTIELARAEANTAAQVAAAKQQEAAELAKVVAAQQAYLASVNGGTQAQQKELQILQLKLAALQAEATQAGNTAQAKAIAAAQAAAAQTKQNDAQRELNKSLGDGAKATDELVKHTASAGPALTGLAAYLQQTRAEMDKLSEKTRLLFEVELTRYTLFRGLDGAYAAHRAAIAAYNDDLSEGGQRLAGFNRELQNAIQLIDQSEQKSVTAATGFQIWEVAIERAAGIAKKAFYEQAIAAETLKQQIDEFAESGIRNVALATTQLANFAQSAAQNFDLLDEQDLSNLRGAIADANAKLRQMQDEARSAQDRIAELNAEIAAEKGDTATADRIKLQLEQQQALADVEAKLAEARSANNRELIDLYEEQRRKLQELYDLKERNLKQDQRQQQQTGGTNGGSSSTSGTAGGVSVGSPSKTYQLNLVGSGGKTITATTNTDPSAFLDELERSQRSSILG